MKTRAALALATAVLLGAALLIMLNGGFTLTLAGIRFRANGAVRLVWSAAALDGLFMALGWRHKPARLIGLLLLACCGAFALVLISREARPTPATGDYAIIESYIFQAMRGQLFLGPYSRFRWHHPGPLYFFLLAPFYVLSGFRTTGVSAAALTINLASLAVLLFVCLRHARGSLAPIVGLLTLAYLLRFGAILASQWNPHVLVLPGMALIAMAAAVASGWVELLPAVAFVATFIVQTHLGLLPTVAVVVLGSLLVRLKADTTNPVVVSGFSRTRETTNPVVVSGFSRTRETDVVSGSSRTKTWHAINVSLWIAFALWFPPIADQIAHTPGNFARLWVFFLNSRANGQPFHLAFQAWSGSLTGLLLPDFVIAWGGQFVAGVSLWVQLCAVVQVGALAVIAWQTARKEIPQERFRAIFAALLALSSLAALWSVTRIEGDIRDHETFWISGLGILNCAVIADAIVRRWLDARLAGAGGALSCAAIFLVVVFSGVSQLRAANDRSFRPGDDEVAAETLSDEVVHYVHDQHVSKVLLDVDGPAWSVAAGVAVQLEKAGVPYAVTDDAVWMFGDAAAQRGDEARTIAISREEHHAQIEQQGASKMLAGRRGFFADLLK